METRQSRFSTHLPQEPCSAVGNLPLLHQRTTSGCAARPAGGAEESDTGGVRPAWRRGSQHEEPPVPGTTAPLENPSFAAAACLQTLLRSLCSHRNAQSDLNDRLFSQTPLHLAVITQQKEAVETLLLAGADPTLTDRHGNTVVHLAAQQEGGGMIQFLLQHKELRAHLEQTNTAGTQQTHQTTTATCYSCLVSMVTGMCALHLAVLANQLSSVRELLEGGACVEAQECSCGRTALHLATETDNVSLAGCLLLEVLNIWTLAAEMATPPPAPPIKNVHSCRQGNARVDSCTFDGSTPLHIAAGRGLVKLTALLIAAGEE